MNRSEDFERAFPAGTLLDIGDVPELERYARGRGFIDGDETLVSVTRAGEGNMNLTLRLETSRRSLVLKQARPWVEKYPAIDAPPGRSRVELAFYETTSARPALAHAMPKLLGSDPASGVLVLEDLGKAQDFTSLYRGETLAVEDLGALVAFLSELHRPWERLPEPIRTVLANREMRALNHEHIFRLPLVPENGLDLESFSPGLTEPARSLQSDRRYVDRVAELGDVYLGDGDALVHGDYFPGSWLRTPLGIRVIDPEFCFMGAAAFDVGFMLGHLSLARQPEALGRELVDRYFDGRGGKCTGEKRLVRGFAGAEIMRRLIGVAQLPIGYDTVTRSELLERSRELVLS